MPETLDYVKQIEELLSSDLSNEEIKDQLDDYHENDIADAFERISKEQRLRLYKILDPETMAEIFTYFDDASDYIEEMDEELAADIIEEMDSDDAIDLLEDLEADQIESLMEKIENEAKEDINLIKSYEEDELGSVMTTNFIKIDFDITLKEAMREVVEQAEDNDNIMTVYVEKNHKFFGAIDLKDLIIARSRNLIDDEDIVMTNYPYVYDHDKIEDKINYIQDYEEDSIPVLNSNKSIIGVITASDVVELVDQELGEDYAKFAGLTEEEEFHEPLKESVRKRLPWLCVLLCLSMGVSTVIGLFEGVVAAIPLVMAFQSLILDMAGNVGTQSLAVTIRVLMDDTLTNGQLFKMILKEGRCGFSCGAILGSIAFVFIGLYVHFIKAKAIAFSFMISGSIGGALLCAMVISSMLGTAIPIFFKKIGVDPAVASGPLITTVNDLVAVISYYSLCWLFLIQILGV